MKKKADNKSILELVKEYNDIEDGQTTRLNELFYSIRELSGAKKVVFSNGELWSNVWQFDERMSQKLVLDRISRKIVKLEI